jgi:hypothetical protein
MHERIELMKAMKGSPTHPREGECDYAPPLDLVGIYIVHTSISRMVERGDLDMAAGTYLNAALGCHAFCILHHCTHESISQSNPEHMEFENMVFRLANLLIFFDDGYKEAHREHHQRTNAPDDPDLILSHSTLPQLGSLLHHMTTQKGFLSIGSPINPPTLNTVQFLGLVPHLTSEKSLLVRWMNVTNWNNMTMKVSSYEALRVLEENPEFKHLSDTLRATWRTASSVSHMCLVLFFARYPHRNGIDGPPNEVDSFYDMTYKGQGQVDLWMMGEGSHHMHHAKSNVSYSLLAKVSEEVERDHPDLKVMARQNMDLEALEYGTDMPVVQQPDDPAANQRFWERTQKMLEAKTLLESDPETGTYV